MRDPVAIFLVVGLFLTLAVALWAGASVEGCTFIGATDQIVCSEGYWLIGEVS